MDHSKADLIKWLQELLDELRELAAYAEDDSEDARLGRLRLGAEVSNWLDQIPATIEPLERLIAEIEEGENGDFRVQFHGPEE